MKAFIVLTLCCAALVRAQDLCYKDTERACKSTTNKHSSPGLPNCSAKYGAIETVLPDLQKFVNTHITRSFEYLLMSTHYGNYEKNREGFEKLFRDLSDEKWAKSIELIKYITKRGGVANFRETEAPSDSPLELYELQALARALDTEKKLATTAHNIHREATRKREESHDPEISDFIEREFAHELSENVRKLAGYTSDLSKILSGPDSSLGLYLFDGYLKQ